MLEALVMHSEEKNGSTVNWATHVLQLGDFLGARVLAHMGVLQSLRAEREQA